MGKESRAIIKSKIGYHLSKVAPFGLRIGIRLRNGLKYIVRSRTMDRSIIKEVWISKVYDQFGIKVEKGDTVIDIGAHIGVFSTYAATLSETGKIYAFEPFMDNFKMLEQHKLMNQKENLFVFNKGVSDTAGKKTLFLSPDNNTGGHSLHLKNHSSNKIEIETIQLGAFCKEHNIHQIDFLKLDCEGAEFEILKSNESILDKVQKVVMECHPYANHTVSEMIGLLERNEFEIMRETHKSLEDIQMLYARKNRN